MSENNVVKNEFLEMDRQRKLYHEAHEAYEYLGSFCTKLTYQIRAEVDNDDSEVDQAEVDRLMEKLAASRIKLQECIKTLDSIEYDCLCSQCGNVQETSKQSEPYEVKSERVPLEGFSVRLQKMGVEERKAVERELVNLEAPAGFYENDPACTVPLGGSIKDPMDSKRFWGK